MANTFITPTVVAKLALPTLRNFLCFAGLVHRDYSKEFKKIGNTVRIRKPAELTAIEFDGDLTGEFQALTESYVDVVMNKHLVVPVEITASELSLDVVSFQAQIVEPAMIALAQKIDELLAGLYVDIPYYEPCESTEAVSDIVNVDKMLNINKVPLLRRSGVLCPKTKAGYIALDAFLHADKRGDNTALKEASMGRVLGIDWFMNQNIKTHTPGTVSTADKITCTKTGDIVNIEAVTDTCDVHAGDLIKASDGQEFVCTELSGDITAGNSVNIKHNPAVSADVAQETITAVAAAAEENLAFNRNAFALVNAPLADPIGGARAATLNFEGLNIQVIYDWNTLGMKNVITFNFLCGVKTLMPVLAMRLRDA